MMAAFALLNIVGYLAATEPIRGDLLRLARKLTFAFDSEFWELALLGFFQFFFAPCRVGMGQIGTVGFLRLPV
jgi:hypothetical protein